MIATQPRGEEHDGLAMAKAVMLAWRSRDSSQRHSDSPPQKPDEVRIQTIGRFESEVTKM
jgi:hypothetical protein